MNQVAPFPTILEDLVARIKYKNGWMFQLAHLDRDQGSEGLTLIIRVTSPDSYDPNRNITVLHYMIVPPAAYNEKSWKRWLLDQVLSVERHEACEYFMIDGVRPYAPHHGPGNDPYTIFDQGTADEAQTNYLGQHFELPHDTAD